MGKQSSGQRKRRMIQDWGLMHGNMFDIKANHRRRRENPPVDDKPEPKAAGLIPGHPACEIEPERDA